MTPSEEAALVEKLYEFGQRLADPSGPKVESDYVGIISAAKGTSKSKQLAAQLIPRFFKHFPNLSSEAINAQLDLCEEDELGIRVQAIRGLPLLCKDTPRHLPKIADVLGQLLLAEESLEKDAVQKALMSLLRQDPKASLTALFEHVESPDENVREKVLIFVREKVFPMKTELLKPQEEMERHVTDLIKKSLQDVTGAEFKMFMDFLKGLSIFGEKAAPERIQELLEIVEGQADLDAQFNVSDTDHIDRLMSCLYLALPIYVRGASNSKFLNYINKHLLPVFDKLSDEKKLDLLKNLAESSPYASAQDARSLLPSNLQLLKKYMPRRKTSEEINYTFVECLLYTFHQLASKTPNTTNSLCGYKIVTGQPSDRLGEDFSDLHKDFMESCCIYLCRLTVVEESAKVTKKKLTQAIGEFGKAMVAAKDDAAKSELRLKQAKTTLGMRTCSNILSLTQPLHEKSPTFLGGDKKITLSWKETPKTVASANAGVKRTASDNGLGSTVGGKKGRGTENPSSFGNRGGLSRGIGRGIRGGWRGRSRGRGY
ncbi:hypothetical protein KP509_10G077800 [Ceratopteris richardii]|uniref:Apoptosis inhibitor 5 n=1 Tax=Ceratopteris richardii TaxID=49495 RepID=A0A8T2TXB1_CERRI|nr:hypothetical protein KP509_10G077800 [Ceratopteris richardii]